MTEQNIFHYTILSSHEFNGSDFEKSQDLKLGKESYLPYKTNKKYIKNGKNNQFPQYLTELFRKSSLHKRCIIGKKTAVQGDGFNIKNVTEIELKQILDFFAKININKIHDALSWSIVKHGEFWVKEIKELKTDGITLKEMNRHYDVVSSHKMRLGEYVYNEEKKKYVIEKYYEHSDWLRDPRPYDKELNP